METRKSKVKFLLKIAKVLGIGIASFISIMSIVNWIYIASGSNEWKLVFKKDDFKAYTLKSPGSSVRKIKMSARLKGCTMSSIFASLIMDTTGVDCQEWIPGCTGLKTIQEWDTKTMSSAHLMTMEMPFPFASREFLYKTHVHQDKETKAVRIDIISAPNLRPPTDGFVRLSHLHDVWHYTPYENGDIEVELIFDVDLGGLFPDILMALGDPKDSYTFFTENLPVLFNKYRSAKYDFIEELNVKKEELANSQ